MVIKEPGLVELALAPDFNGIPLASAPRDVSFRNNCIFELLIGIALKK